MKLKSKLIATIVSMCAAIAVMGVGVWASTSQNFTVTVKNDVDIKILNINADVYGEFAVYSQFAGSSTDGSTPGYATRITGTTLGEAYTSRADYDHGYLLYAIGIGGYNDGKTGAFDGSTDYTKNADKEYGYAKYINETKNNVFLATKNGTLANSNTTTTDLMLRATTGAPFEKSYNVDSTTHIAQVAYMYTINQWAADGASNAIYGKINAALTQATIDKIAATAKGSAYNSLIIPSLYAGKLNTTSGETAWQQLTIGATGDSLFEIASTQGAEATDVGGTYYIVLTFTFARNNANLDLQELQDSLQHSLTLVTEDEKATLGTEFTTIGGGTAKVYSATSGSLSSANAYTVQGAALKPVTTDIKEQVTGAYNQDRLKNTFALAANDNTKSFLPAGFIYLAAEGGDLDTTFKWVKDLYQGGRSSQTPYGVAVA